MRISIACTRTFLIFALTLYASVAAPTVKAAPKVSKWNLFRGEWFDIRYPRGWSAHRGARSNTAAKGTDSARFHSPDGQVEFYVFSPMWNGTPDTYNAKRETVVARKVQTQAEDAGKHQDALRTIWLTTRANDRSYWRSVVDRENISRNTRHVFAFRYRDTPTRRKYAAAFDLFKKSLRQYLD